MSLSWSSWSVLGRSASVWHLHTKFKSLIAVFRINFWHQCKWQSSLPKHIGPVPLNLHLQFCIYHCICHANFSWEALSWVSAHVNLWRKDLSVYVAQGMFRASCPSFNFTLRGLNKAHRRLGYLDVSSQLQMVWCRTVKHISVAVLFAQWLSGWLTAAHWKYITAEEGWRLFVRGVSSCQVGLAER